MTRMFKNKWVSQLKFAEIISPATPFYRNDKSSVVPSSAAILEVEQFSSVDSTSLQHWRHVNVIGCLHMMQYASINTNKKTWNYYSIYIIISFQIQPWNITHQFPNLQ